ncbi:MAG: EAL domain-containing protein [Massilia sp.]
MTDLTGEAHAAPLNGANALAHWRAQIFARILLVVLVLGTGTAVPSMILAASEGGWSIVVIDSISIAWLAILWWRRTAAYRWRVLQFLAIAFVVSIGLVLKVGAVSHIYMIAIPVLAALLLGLRPALWALGATALAIVLLSLLHDPTPQMSGFPTYALVRAPIVALNYLFIAGVLTLSCAFLLRHLEASLDGLQASAMALEQGRNALAVLNGELRLTSAAVARLNDMVMIAEVVGGDEEPRIIFVNHAFELRSGYTRGEALGRGLRLLRGAETDADTLERIAGAMRQAQPLRFELLNYGKGGDSYWVEAELTPLADEGGNYTHWVAVEREISQRKTSEAKIHRLAFYDALTGLPNRSLLMNRIEHLLAGAARSASCGALMFVDLDHFKHINDARGHATGDALLRIAATRMAGLLRKGDTVARIGGDEFVVLLAGLSEDLASAGKDAARLAEKVRGAISANFDIDGQSYRCSASIGVTMLPRGGLEAADLLREADIAMYRAKADGRNTIAFFEADMQANVERRLTLERELAGAIDAGALEMHVQPQVDRHGVVTGAEMLMRWRRADGAMVPPSIVIPLAEESGLIVKLGRWALEQSCAAAVALARAGHQLPLSVNVSPTQFRHPAFAGDLQATLATYGAPASSVILELTEGVLIEKLDASVRRMAELAALGIRFSIDDFGTGYSSLAYLKKLPLYELKIDKSFIDEATENASDRAIVETILSMARHLGLRVVAEGVETRAQANFLIERGCDSMQGYLFARPMPLVEFMALMLAGGGRLVQVAVA